MITKKGFNEVFEILRKRNRCFKSGKQNAERNFKKQRNCPIGYRCCYRLGFGIQTNYQKSANTGMSRDVLTIAGSKMSVKSYDFELGRWNGSPHIKVTHWMELPSPPCRIT